MALELRTERLEIRPLTASDEAAVVAQLGDYEVSRWLTVVPYPYTPKDFRDFLDFLEAEPREGLAIHDAEGLVGVIGATDRLGYWLGRAHHGKGYMSEAAQAVVADHFARGAEDMHSGYFEGNGASARVLEKLGFAHTGQSRRVNSVAQGAEATLKALILTREAWEARHGH
ncbi:GNAT family N-acetyltransferase [Aliiroseovarius sp.]|uniref:GNAT family N-acetyltransferase n=1 Tax=Aliiroseovarius sp. TaxID=1872442 RepID=UPI003BAA348F